MIEAAIVAGLIALDQQLFELMLASLATAGVVAAAILPSIFRNRNEAQKARLENHRDHGKVQAAVDQLARQVATLTALVVESVSELKAHTKWEEGQKYTSPEDIEKLIEAIKEHK